MISRLWPIDSRLRYWHPVALVSNVTTKPLAIRCCGVPITLFANGRNSVVAMYDRCAHRRMPLSSGTVGADGISCPYHGCEFAPDGTGYCPTTRSNRFRIPVFETKSLCGVVWLRSRDAMDSEGLDASADKGLSAELTDDDHVFTCVIEKRISAPLQLVIDNMTELEHTGKVHRRLAFGIDDFDTVETRCEHDDEGVPIFYRGRQRPLPSYLSVVLGLRPGDYYLQTARVSFTPPCASYRIWWVTGDQKTRAFGLRFVNYYTETDAGYTSLFCFVYWKTQGALVHRVRKPSAAYFRRLVSTELGRDKSIIEKVPRAEATLDWFQLNHFDKPLVATRKLMQRHYSAFTPAPRRREVAGPPPEARERVELLEGNRICY